ncbi:HesA/MoeB/ThiF family protein [Cucumibacter marinus]|uniref:HesA/MoeB/ThiF family protein n=1 Tax=Cucumibacter marinus TaxID=1121252 RepID=UPI00042451FE|nr:molybdopterin-synthase adenylyltransferase MoeB [Cucumibacter marinus]
MALSTEETRRYARHIVLKGIGGAGQQKLRSARIALVGAGGLGSPALAYLTAAGIGHIRLIDDDTVSLSNLQRQVIHRSRDTGTGKAESGARFASDLNDHVEVEPVTKRLDRSNAQALLGRVDLVLDGSDSFETREAVAQACETLKVPLISGAITLYDGTLTVLAPYSTDAQGRLLPRFTDLYPETPSPDSLPACEEVGVLGPVAGVIGTLMAMEAIKLITGTGEPLFGRLMVYDGLSARFSEFRYARKG